MEPKDMAFERFIAFKKSLTPDYWESIQTEADTRKKLIDRIFAEVLGWPEEAIHLESGAGEGFIDYRFTVKKLNRLIVEAKKESRDLGVNSVYAGRYFKLNGTVFRSKNVTEGIQQAVTYCAFKSAELACVSNGMQWIIFRGNRLGDGKDILDGVACCFGSLEAVEEKFSHFYDLLSYDSVSNYTFRGLFQEAEGQPLRSSVYRAPVRTPESKNFISTDKLHADLDRIMLSFFQDLKGNDDPEARRACFVITEESSSAEENLARISEDLRNKVRQLENNEGLEIAEAIKRVQEMKRKELVLLVGTKGAGKSTFIDRFFLDYLPKEIADDCVVVRIDLLSCGCDYTGILKWLDEHFLEAVEKAAFKGEIPDYEDLMGMYFKEYQRWSTGSQRHLYETDKNQFKIDFGRHIERRREERPHEYIVHLLHRIVGAFSKVPCLVFDNADHFDVKFQEEVFKYAHALFEECLSLVIVPITDTTSWQLHKQGALQSFHTDSYFLPTPPTEQILRRRIEYIEEKVKTEKPEKGQGYFFGKGIPLSIENIKAFAACLQAVFLKTPQVAHWIGSLSNKDVRRSLQLTREIIASPHIQAGELLNSYIQGSGVTVAEENIKLAIIKAKYDIFSATNNSFIQNVFNLSPGTETSPLLGVRILQVLKDHHVLNPDNDARYVLIDTIGNYIHALGVESHVTISWLNAMLNTGLVLSYDPTLKEITPNVRIEISPSGRQHLLWALKDWTYLESMMETTPLYDEDIVSRIESMIAQNSPYYRKKAIQTFIDYLLKEDAGYCLIPKVQQYESQVKIANQLNTQLLFLSNKDTESTGRYNRYKGRVSVWKSDQGYGFIKSSHFPDGLFLHIDSILEPPREAPSIGDVLEFDLGETQRGPRAINVVKAA